MADDFTERYRDLLTGWYDCVDRIVLNACYPMGSTAGGFRTWWRRLIGGGDAEADAVLDDAHLMRLAGRFARRVRAWAAGNAVPVIDCTAGERKHLVAEEYLRTHPVGPGVFMVLVARAPAMVWDVRRSADGAVIGGLARKRTYVNHYSFHIMDPAWGHLVIKMAGHAPFTAQVILNGHEYVAVAAQGEGIGFTKEGNCFTETADPAGLAQIADTLSQDAAAGRLGQVIDRWICTACLISGLDLAGQQRTCVSCAYPGLPHSPPRTRLLEISEPQAARLGRHRKRDSIEAHLTIVFAALAVSRWIEHRTGWSIRKFVKTARRYRTIGSTGGGRREGVGGGGGGVGPAGSASSAWSPSRVNKQIFHDGCAHRQRAGRQAGRGRETPGLPPDITHPED